MLKALQRAWNGDSPETKEKEMKKDDVSAEAQATVKDVVENLVSENASASELADLKQTLETKSGELEAALKQLSAANEKLEAFAAQAAQAEVEAKKVLMDSRIASLSAVIGDVQAAGIVAATESLDNAAFAKVAESLKLSMDKEADSPMFKEVGADAQADATKIEEKSLEMKKIEEKYSKKAGK